MRAAVGLLVAYSRPSRKRLVDAHMAPTGTAAASLALLFCAAGASPALSATAGEPAPALVGLVTGASSGIGFETAAQLAASGRYERVILACRTVAKAASARTKLVERAARLSGRGVNASVFELLEVDLSSIESSRRAGAQLAARSIGGAGRHDRIHGRRRIDTLILNAGVATASLERSVDGLELDLAVSVVGHHVLTTELLGAGALSPRARIVIAASDVARDVFVPSAPSAEREGSARARARARSGRHDMDSFYRGATAAAAGSLAKALELIARGEYPREYDAYSAYANAKAWAVWWAQALARRVPPDTAVLAVSPGAVGGTDIGRAVMPKSVRKGLMSLARFGPMIGLGTVEQAARRYLDAVRFADASRHVSGTFWASPAGRYSGKLTEVTEARASPRYSESVWQVLTTRLTEPVLLATSTTQQSAGSAGA